MQALRYASHDRRAELLITGDGGKHTRAVNPSKILTITPGRSAIASQVTVRPTSA